MHFTHYQKAGDKVFAVNPFPSEVVFSTSITKENPFFREFNYWLSTQPPIYADPSIKDGVYAKELFEEPVWQTLAHSGKDAEYITVTELTAKMSPGFLPRLYIRLKQPEIEANCNGCGKEIIQGELFYTVHNGDDYCEDCYNAIQSDDESSGRLDNLKQPVKQEEKPIKKISPNKIAVQFLRDNGFTKMDEPNHYANDFCGVVITETNYEVADNFGNVMYSHDLNLYWLLGYLLYKEWIGRNFKRPL